MIICISYDNEYLPGGGELKRIGYYLINDYDEWYKVHGDLRYRSVMEPQTIF